ncbi:efflux RND transporter permease subunit [Porticoccus sp.]|uniref:efflux RND transporter permease subunit n=1 Tax=Porticoccus sp. TaxID=2024853 RepID=UPI003F6995D5
MSARLLRIYETIVLRHPLAVLIATLSLAVGMAFGLPNFKLDASADSLTLEHDADLDYFRQTLQHYGSSDFLVVTYTPKEGDLFDDDSLATLAEIRDELRQIEGVTNITSMLDVPLLYSPKVKISQLKDEPRKLTDKDTDRDQARQEFLESPIYRNLILSPDGQTTALLATMELDRKYLDLVRKRDSLRLKRDTEGLTAEEEIELERVSKEFLDYRTERAAIEHQRVAEVREKMAAFKDRAELFLGGPSMITADMIDFIKSDLRIFGTGIVLFIILTLAIIFRQLRWVVLPLLTCLLSVEIMLGYLSWIDWRLTVISSNFVALLLIITLALTIHLIVRYREILAESPERSQLALVSETVSYMARPCLYTVLTTVVAFVSLVVSDIRPVIDFGWMMTMGITLALILAFLVIPAGMMLLGKGQNNDNGDNSAAYTLYFSRFTENHGGLVLGLALLAAVISGWGISQLQVENRFIDYFRSNTEIHQGLSVIDEKLGGTTPLDIILDAPKTAAPPTGSDNGAGADEKDPFAEEDPFAADDPFGEEDPFADGDSSGNQASTTSYWFTGVGIQELDKLHDYLESLPEVGKVNSLVTITDVAEDLMGHRLNDLELAFLRNSLSRENAELLFDPYIDDELNQARITLRIRETGGELKRPELLESIRRFAVEEVGLQEDQVHLTSLLVLYNNMLQSLFRSQILTLGAVFIGIMAMFLVLFRSLSISLIAILPNMLAATVVLGGMGIARIPLDMMTITIAAITVGIGVDHAIHYITRFKREFVVDRNYLATMHRAHASIGRALFYTAITIIIGFSILALSNFIPSVYFGLLTGLAMLAALLGSMTLLPKLILIFKPFGK